MPWMWDHFEEIEDARENFCFTGPQSWILRWRRDNFFERFHYNDKIRSNWEQNQNVPSTIKICNDPVFLTKEKGFCHKFFLARDLCTRPKARKKICIFARMTFLLSLSFRCSAIIRSIHSVVWHLRVFEMCYGSWLCFCMSVVFLTLTREKSKKKAKRKHNKFETKKVFTVKRFFPHKGTLFSTIVVIIILTCGIGSLTWA